MKNIICRLSVLAFAVLLCAMGTSCKKSDSDSKNKTQDEIEKSWPDILTTESGTFVKIQRNITEDFFMGSENGTPSEQPMHKIRFSKSFYMATTEATQQLWKSVMGSNPSDDSNKGDDNPVDNVSYNDIMTFIKNLNEQTGREYRLPTEAEWEYAARGGIISQGFIYAGSNDADEVAWCNSEDEKSHPVASKKANEYGLYDMSGNVWEICGDKMSPYQPDEQLDPVGSSGNCAMRGGCFDGETSELRTTARSGIKSGEKYYNIGFRLVLSKPLDKELKKR